MPDRSISKKPTSKGGRPKGSTQYEQAKTDGYHCMTPKAHAFIKQNKKLIEDMARKRYEIQWKML